MVRVPLMSPMARIGSTSPQVEFVSRPRKKKRSVAFKWTPSIEAFAETAIILKGVVSMAAKAAVGTRAKEGKTALSFMVAIGRFASSIDA